MVKAKNANKLASIDASHLKVFKNKVELSGEPLKNSAAVTCLGQSEEDALLVVVPESNLACRAPSGNRHRLRCLLSRSLIQ